MYNNKSLYGFTTKINRAIRKIVYGRVFMLYKLHPVQNSCLFIILFTENKFLW